MHLIGTQQEVLRITIHTAVRFFFLIDLYSYLIFDTIHAKIQIFFSGGGRVPPKMHLYDTLICRFQLMLAFPKKV